MLSDYVEWLTSIARGKDDSGASSRLLPLIIVTALGTGSVAFRRFRKYRNNCKLRDSNEISRVRPFTMRYPLKLHGNVDRIFERHGPRPFEFNTEVVEVFDDMVSRSVPLYCEVIDLLLYWCHRHYKPGTSIVDLGCSTGTTLDVVARSFEANEADNADGSLTQTKLNLIGVDNSAAMVKECRSKLRWVADKGHDVEVVEGNVLEFPISNTSFVIMNYTLQFISVPRRKELLDTIFHGLCEGGVFFISEKVRCEAAVFQETSTWIYEDFKERRGYSRREIARKKEALMNVLIPYTEKELKTLLFSAGFDEVEVVAKWNTFVTIVARKSRNHENQFKLNKKIESWRTPNLDTLLDNSPLLSSGVLPSDVLQKLAYKRIEFNKSLNYSHDALARFEKIAKMVLSLPKGEQGLTHCVVNQPVLEIGRSSDLSETDQQIWKQCAESLKPWKKGPLSIFGVDIDTEWRSDWKWERIANHLPSLEDKVVCDLGCANGYFMFRMLEHKPKAVFGIDPNLHAMVEFKIFQWISGVENIHLELLRGDSMTLFPKVFDIVFCLGVLYHTPDPVGMLRDIHMSMKKGAHLIVDCSGIPGDDPIALFPKKKYAGMNGVYFLPTINALKNWLQRANFVDATVLFSEKLSTDEQRITEWAPMNSSLAESLDPSDQSLTVEGYPAPYRFYIKAKRG